MFVMVHSKIIVQRPKMGIPCIPLVGSYCNLVHDVTHVIFEEMTHTLRSAVAWSLLLSQRVTSHDFLLRYCPMYDYL
jgi:hypothetical protein